MKKIFEIQLGREKLIAEINDLAEKASGSCFIRYGGSMVLSTVTASKEEKENIEFFPLTVEYEERYYAAGKIKGPRFVKRETRPSDEAICNARMIDRALRPLFPLEFKREVQIINTVLSWDAQNDPDILGLIGSSLALSISAIPWGGPVGAVRVGKIGENFILNPTYEEKEKSEMDVVFSGIEKDGDILVNMIEGGFERSKEETILEAFDFAKPYLKLLIDFQKEIAKTLGAKKIEIQKEEEKEIKNAILEHFGEKIQNAFLPKESKEGSELLEKLFEEVRGFLKEKFPEKVKLGVVILKKELKKELQKIVIEKGIRPDGRTPEQIREIFAEVSVLPRTHGSAIFCRGKTKTLSILTLGGPSDVQLLDGMEISGKKRFMHHYNFPPYCAGEVGSTRGPGRREIGHGMLVERALLPVIPSFDDFPYTIRIVSEVLCSNGSTSMASVCSSSLALMDAGVPIKDPVAGIALGLALNEKGDYKILTDIQGPEDHFGNMDFKVAGTKDGVTAIQMDLKIEGISKKIFEECLKRAKEARIKILEIMRNILPEPRKELSSFAPRVLAIQINPQKIREVIGPSGRVINEIISECGVSIEIEENGKIFVTAEKEEAAKKAIAWIKNITREVKVGEVFQGKVKRILSFGIMVEILPGQEGLLHVSQLKRKDKNLKTYFKVGEIIPVKVISIDDLGRINLGLAKANFKKE